MTIGCEVVGAYERSTLAVSAYEPHLLSTDVDLCQRIGVIACDQQMVLPGDEAAGAAAVLMPVDASSLTVPVFYVAAGVLHVEQPAVIPKRPFRILGFGVDGDELTGRRRRYRRAQEPGDHPEPWPRPRTPNNTNLQLHAASIAYGQERLTAAAHSEELFVARQGRTERIHHDCKPSHSGVNAPNGRLQ